MKKVTLILGMLAAVAIVSCKEKEETPAPETTTTETTTIVTPAPEKNTDGTSISVDKNGVEYSSKNGSNSTTVKVEGGDSKVEVKK
jgi:hypothetical protein